MLVYKGVSGALQDCIVYLDRAEVWNHFTVTEKAEFIKHLERMMEKARKAEDDGRLPVG